MEGFKKIVKMKTGGSVSKAVAKCSGGSMKKGGEVDAADIKQDKAIVKKAFSMHDKQEHGGEKTDLSKLKRGGRSKKEAGTVRKFKTGGSVTNVYEAKKSSGDIDNIRKTKDIVPGKAAAPSKAAVKGKDVGTKTVGASGHKDPYIKSKQSGKKAAAPSGAKGPDAYKCGGKVKKMAEGKSAGQPGATPAQQKYYDTNKAKGDAAAKKADYEAFGSRGDAAKKGMEEGRMDTMGNAYKKGGKIKKYADGGYTGDDPIVKYRMGMTDAQGNPTAPATAPTASPVAPSPSAIEDESGRGNVSPAAAAFNKDIPGAGPMAPATALRPAPRTRRVTAMKKPGMIDNLLAKPGVKNFLDRFNQSAVMGAKKGGKVKDKC
jgi:hypothetical protein